MSDATDIWESFDRTVLVTWDEQGLPLTLTGGMAGPLSDGTLHTITAWNPLGVVTDPKANAEAHGHLFRRVEELALGAQPVVGASPDGSRHELGILTGDLSRADAVALGAAFDQLAIFELDDESVRVLPCGGSRAVTSLERWRPLDEVTFTYNDVIAWRAEHEEITGTRLPRTLCPRCGAADPQRFLWGMPATIPPDWVALGGCCIGPDEPDLRCRACTHTW